MDNEDIRTIWCGNLSDKITEDLLYELFMQGGPVQKVSIPKDRDGKQKTFGFVTYKHECSVPYAMDLFDGTTLFNRTLNMKTRNNITENSYQRQNQQECYDRQQRMQTELQLGQQILLGSMSHLGFAANSMSMMPGNVTYPSQGGLYSQNPSQGGLYSPNPQNSPDYRNNRQHNRNHPYQDHDHYNDRRNNRQESFNRDHKSRKHSSHRSNRHDNRRKYR